jgi:hypothetical protein
MGSSQKYWQFDRDCAPWASKIRDQCVLITTPSHGLLIGLSIEPYPLKLLKEDLDLVSHAALRIPVWDIAKFLRIDLENSHDDFDYYEGVSAISDKGYQSSITVGNRKGLQLLCRENSSAIYR